MHVIFTLKSRNAKVGPIPVSTSAPDTCPSACPLKTGGCYAKSGPLGIMWAAMTKQPGADGRVKVGRGNVTMHTWDRFCASVEGLDHGTLWRHNQAGDLPGDDDTIDTVALALLVRANAGKRGFTYTHKPLNPANSEAIRAANLNGFTINLSADNLSEADTLADTGIGPVVVILPDTVTGPQDIATPKGRPVAVCPATYRDDTNCQSCQLCQRQNRKVIVGFPAHGSAKRKASAIAIAS